MGSGDANYVRDDFLYLLYMRELGVDTQECREEVERRRLDVGMMDELLSAGLVTVEGQEVSLTEAGRNRVDRVTGGLHSVRKASAFEVGARAFTLEVSFVFDFLTCTRKLLVPAHVTFEDLHTMLQACMSWMNYHAYEFEVPHLGSMLTVSPKDEDTMGFLFGGFGMADERGEDWRDINTTYLDDLLPVSSELLYRYDFGDGWEMHIRLAGESTLDRGMPLCLEGVGDAPPEDVGGEGGFMDFLDLMEDPSDPEHDEMLAWAHDQGWDRFDIGYTNVRLAAWRSFAAMGSSSEAQPKASGQVTHGAAGGVARSWNDRFIQMLAARLAEDGISDKTIRKHTENMRLFLNDYLAPMGCTLEEGPDLIDDFIGRWFMDYHWPSKTALRSLGTSLRKFYRTMADAGEVDEEDYAEVCAVIKKGMAGWLEKGARTCESLGNSPYVWVKTS